MHDIPINENPTHSPRSTLLSQSPTLNQSSEELTNLVTPFPPRERSIQWLNATNQGIMELADEIQNQLQQIGIWSLQEHTPTGWIRLLRRILQGDNEGIVVEALPRLQNQANLAVMRSLEQCTQVPEFDTVISDSRIPSLYPSPFQPPQGNQQHRESKQFRLLTNC
ncbi:hypothetical protein GYMLUDRAFT_59344 [Collybiopsis luxurians FD-317 M1]|uniref:Uncharacterized protein n=1 Tax=Collybiopsis luxurians FD-317 M1 TaxID=944289 RepID=A0A0D0BA54_9AGAR|nr:hypothetical protein GYMLUDRAFT_59344 [Collybiopsis luxurians FD-317 M1]